MKKYKKIIATIIHKTLFFKYAISERWYLKSMNKYLLYIGVDLVGKPKFFARDVKIDYTDPKKIHIGNNSVITSNVTLLVHDYSIECGLTAIHKNDPIYESVFIRDIVIGNNCFIGQNVFIKPGTKIGNNCIVGAGSVVSGIYPDNSIIIGNPSKIVANTVEWAEKKYIEQKYIRGNRRKIND